VQVSAAVVVAGEVKSDCPWDAELGLLENRPEVEASIEVVSRDGSRAKPDELAAIRRTATMTIRKFGPPALTARSVLVEHRMREGPPGESDPGMKVRFMTLCCPEA
jgi:hypothetical protein